ncbi:unnamed protein product [Lymnaea stagnalis]|uniref:Uncharacterized protein n=1 Tax=Lymnaea stagnalis TaxID=6523 RepID=A0AAV2IB34_LYMST
MCFGLGLSCCIALIEILCYLSLVTVPLLGSFYGADTIYRISIHLIIHSLLIECIPKFLKQAIPFFSLILFVLLIFIPITLTPWIVIWIYSNIIFLTEPFLKIAEVIVILNFVMRMSQSAADEIERDESSSFNYKGAILVASSLCYAVTASLAYDIYQSAASSQVLCLFLIILFSIALHNMMWMAHEGIISDCAFTCLVNVAVLYTMYTETEQISSPLVEPLTWKQSFQTKQSVINIITSIIFMKLDNAQRAISFLKRFFTPLFLGLFAIRLYSILFIVKKVTRNFFQDEDEILTVKDFEEDTDSPWKSPALLKISIIFMLTQFTGHFLEDWSGQTSSDTWLLNATEGIWPSQLLISRLVQIMAVNVFYMWRLYQAEDWTWNIWLTP